MKWPCCIETQRWRAVGVDSGDETPCRNQQQAKAYCETSQCNEIAKNAPEAHGPPLEREWEMYASSEI